MSPDLRIAGPGTRAIDPLELDPAAAEANKRHRHVRFNVVELPAMRVLGFTLIALTAYLHNTALTATLAIQPRLGVPAFAVIAAAYCLAGAEAVVPAAERWTARCPRWTALPPPWRCGARRRRTRACRSWP